MKKFFTKCGCKFGFAQGTCGAYERDPDVDHLPYGGCVTCKHRIPL